MSEEQDRQARQESVQVYTPLRRRAKRRKSVYSRPTSKRLLVVILLVLVMILGGVAAYQHYHLAHYAIAINGKQLVAVATVEDAAQAVKAVKLKYAPHAPSVVTFTEGEITVDPIKHSMTAVSPKAAAEVLDRNLVVQLEGYAIFVSGIPLVLLESKEHAVETISLMLQRGLDLQRGLNGRNGLPTFKQRVTIDLMHLTKDKIGSIPVMTPEQAAEELVHPPRKAVHTVKLGDSYWSIANAHGLLIADLDKLNPGKSHLLHEGDIINLPDQPSAVTVIVR